MISNIYTFVYIVFVLFWSPWPRLLPVTAKNIDNSVLATFAAIALSTVSYHA